MSLLKPLALWLAAFALLFNCSAASAGVNDSMDAFWNDSLASSNGAGPSAYQGQEAGYYTLGNYSYRAPQYTSQISSVSLPSVKAGCGGIDIYGGSFSFINTDQIVATFKAVAQNAMGLLFQMAVKSLSELLGNEIEQMFNLVQKANLGAINSCEAAQQLVNGAVNALPSGALKSCMEIGLQNGTYVDEAAARAACGFGGEAEHTIANASDAQRQSQAYNRNIAWEAIMKHPLFASDNQLAETMMTLTGTTIVKVGDGGVPELHTLAPDADSDGMITALLDGGAIKVHQCSDDSCLTVVPYGQTVNVAGLKAKVVTVIDGIVGKIIAKQALNTQEVDFLGLATIPMYKIASVQVAANKDLAAAEMEKYADAIATDILIGWLEANLHAVAAASADVVGTDAETTNAWRAGMRDIIARLDQRQQLIENRITAVQQLIQRTRMFEEDIAADTTSRLAQSILYANTKSTS
jgi:conjugative transfer pilus assembly protein TraH